MTGKKFFTHDASGEKFSGFGDSGGLFVVDEKLLGVLASTNKLLGKNVIFRILVCI